MTFTYCAVFGEGCRHYYPYGANDVCAKNGDCPCKVKTKSEEVATIIRGMTQLMANQQKILEKLDGKSR